MSASALGVLLRTGCQRSTLIHVRQLPYALTCDGATDREYNVCGKQQRRPGRHKFCTDLRYDLPSAW